VIPLGAQSQAASQEEQAIRKLIQTFADSRNSHDGSAVANLYSEDGEWIATRGSRRVRGRVALAQLWGGLTGQVGRTVESIDLPSDCIAIVRVMTDYGQPIGRHQEVFVVVKELGVWRIPVHQTGN